MSEDQRKKIIQEDEIDLLDLAKVIWSRRIFIIKVTAAFAALGLLIAFTSKVEYEASCKLMPESQEGIKNNLGGLSGLAGLAGIDLGLSGTVSLTPDLYPEIVTSIPFQLDIIHQPIRFEKIDSIISSYNYFKEIDRPSLFSWLASYTIGLPGKIRGFFSSKDSNLDSEIDDSLIRLTKDDEDLIENFKKRVSVVVNENTGVISIISEMPDQYAAAKITDLFVKKLTQEVTAYKIGKARVTLEFIQERYLEAEEKYNTRQRVLAEFTDRNKNITSSLVQIEYQRLQNDMTIALEVYKSLAGQLEQAKIKVKEETPVFTILEPVRIPTDNSKPQRRIILLISIFLGVIASTVFVLIKHRFLNIKK